MMAKKLKKVFAILLCISMLMSMLSISAFAASDKETQADKQIVSDGGTNYYKADGSTGSKDDHAVALSKNVLATGEENVFDIELKVETSLDRSKVVDCTPDAAVVLTIDMSGTMDKNDMVDVDDIDGDKNKTETVKRVAVAKAKANQFLDEYAASAAGTNGKRYVAVTQFNTYAVTLQGWIDVSNASNLAAVKSKINQITVDMDENDRCTNMEAATLLSGNLLQYGDDTVKNIPQTNKWVVLLSDGAPTVGVKSGKETSTSVDGWPSGINDNTNGGGTNPSDVDQIKGFVDRIKGMSNMFIIGITPDVNSKVLIDRDKTSTAWNAIKPTVTGASMLLSTWLEALVGSGNYYAANSSTELAEKFAAINADISKKTTEVNAFAWKALDPIGGSSTQCVDFIGFWGQNAGGADTLMDALSTTATPAQQNNATYTNPTDEAGGEINWNLKDSKYTTKNGVDTYALKYRIKLDNRANGFVSGKSYATNGTTTLKYQVINDNTAVDVGPVNFPIPQVKGYLGEFSFLKQNVAEEALTGAQFTLYAAETFESVEQPGTPLYTANSTDGTVSFKAKNNNAIASGRSYKMVETQAPAGYNLEKAQETVYDVIVEYGDVTVKNGSKTVTVIVNEKNQEPTSVTVKKIWVDGNNADSTRPASIEFDLMQKVGNDNATKYGTYTLTAEDGWTRTISGLDSIDLKTNKPITYSVVEKTVDGYSSVAGVDKADGALTITNTVGTISDTVPITLNKTWVGPNGGSVEITLSRTSAKPGSAAEVVGIYEVTGTKTIEKQPKYDGEGYRYTYTAVETAVSGYSAVSSNDGTNFNFTNVVDQDTKSVNGTKIWNITALGDSVVEAVFTLTASNYEGFEAQTDTVTSAETEYRFDNLPVYVYTLSDGTQTTTISESDLANVTAAEEIAYEVKETSTGADNIVSDKNGTTFINTLQEDIKITVQKVWDDSDNRYETRPDSVTLVLTGSDGSSQEWTFEAEAVYEEVEKTVTTEVPAAEEGGEPTVVEEIVTEQKLVGYSWDDVTLAHEFTVDKYDGSGAPINYTVSEKNVQDNTIVGKDGTEYTVTYNQDTYTVTNTLGGGDLVISGVKTWVDGNNAGSTRPESIEVGLFKAGVAEAVQSVTVIPDGDGNWNYTFEAVDLYENGEKVIYTVQEITALEKYTTTYSGDNNRNIKNTLTQENFSITGTKAWVDGENRNGLRPESVTLVLTGSDGSEKKGVVNAENNWTYEFTALDKYDASGSVIVYTLDEEALAGNDYEKTSAGNKDNGYIVTNTLKKSNISVSVSKQWISDEDCSEKEVSVQLYQNGEAYRDAQTITGNSSVSFLELPKYDDSYAPYVYTVKEAAGVPDGYTSVVSPSGENSFAITNTKNIVNTTIGVEKTFVGPTVEGSIFAGLFRVVGETYTKVDTVELNAANEWKASFTAQPVTDSSHNRYDYVVRELTSADDAVGLLGGEKNGDYTVAYTGSNNRVITNTIDQVTKSLTVEKKWSNMDASGTNVNPTEKPVKIQLGYKVADQFVPYGAPVTLLASGDWTYTYENLPTYALASAELSLTDGSIVVYEIREVAEDGSLVQEGMTINLGTDNRFTVNYTTDAETGNLVVTNTFDTPEKYYYRVDRHYSATIDGVTTTGYVAGDLVTVLPNEDREISIGADNTFDVDASAYVSYGGRTYSYDGSNPVDVQILELPNHEYVIHLYYVYTYTTPYTPPYTPPYIPPVIIEDEEPPLANLPDEEPPLAELPDEEVPLAVAPATGDASMIWMALSALSGAGLFLTRKKREDEE